MMEGFVFVGIGDDGNRIADELSKMYGDLGTDLFNGAHADPEHRLRIDTFSFTDTTCDGKDEFVILAGSVHDPHWQAARKAVHDRRPYLMMTIAVGTAREAEPGLIQPYADECLVFSDRPLSDPAEIAQLVMRIFFIHTPWNECGMGSLIGYDLADTRNLFAGKVATVRKMTSDKEQYRQNFSKFLSENKEDLSRAQGILMSFWGRDEVLSIPKVSKLWDEMECLLMPDAHRMLTFHILPEDGPDFMATLFLAL